MQTQPKICRPSFGFALLLASIFLCLGGCDDNPVAPDAGTVPDLKSISGRVVLAETGDPVANAKVFLNRLSFDCWKMIDPLPALTDTALTDRFGRFNFKVPQGPSYQIYAAIEGDGTPTRFSHLAPQMTIDMTLLESAKLVDMGLQEVVAGSSLSGTTYDKASGDILSATSVTLTRLEGFQYVPVSEVASDDEGQFGFADLYTGIYRVVARKETVIDTYLVTIEDIWGPIFLPSGASFGFYAMNLEGRPICLP